MVMDKQTAELFIRELEINRSKLVEARTKLNDCAKKIIERCDGNIGSLSTSEQYYNEARDLLADIIYDSIAKGDK